MQQIPISYTEIVDRFRVRADKKLLSCVKQRCRIYKMGIRCCMIQQPIRRGLQWKRKYRWALYNGKSIIDRHKCTINILRMEILYGTIIEPAKKAMVIYQFTDKGKVEISEW